MSRSRPRTRALVAVGVLVTLVLAGGISLLASDAPDGLERVAQEQGFAGQEREPATADGPLAGYDARGVGDERVSGAVAGVAGTMVVLALGAGLFLLLRRRDGEQA